MYWLQWRYLKRWCRATLHSQTDKHVDVDIYMEAQTADCKQLDTTIYSHTHKTWKKMANK